MNLFGTRRFLKWMSKARLFNPANIGPTSCGGYEQGHPLSSAHISIKPSISTFPLPTRSSVCGRGN